MKKKILITGGAGFIGSNLALALQEQFPENEYTIVDDFSCGVPENIKEFSGGLVRGNVVDVDVQRELPSGIDVIFHQAAITDTTLTDRQKMFEANVTGFQNILKLAEMSGARVIYASSAAVYGASPPPSRLGEGERPLNVYGESKLEMDEVAKEYLSARPEIPIIGMRYFNVYGPREAHKGKMASMIWQLYLQMKEGRRPCVFEFGEQRRDFVYVKDVVAANLLALQATKSGIVNVGTGESRSFKDIIAILNDVMGTTLEPEYFENPYAAFYQEHTEADLAQARELLAYEPQYTLEAGIRDYLKGIA